MNLEQLYNLAKPLTSKDIFLNKYTFLAYNNIIEAKYLSVNSLPQLDTKLSPYIMQHSKILLFPSKINNIIDTIVVRPMLTNGTPLTLASGKLPFNIGNISEDFKYGDPLILVEGLADIGGLKLIDNTLNIIAFNSSALAKQYYEIVASLTHNIILLPDKDKTGEISIRKMKREFKKFNISLKVVEQFQDLKDTGDIVELLLQYNTINNKQVKQVIKQKLNLIKVYYKTALSAIM